MGEALLLDQSDVVQMKMYLENGRAFFARWRQFLEAPEAMALCGKLRAHYAFGTWLDALRQRTLQSRL